MPNDKQLISHCRGCDRERHEGERFSARGKCYDCGNGRMHANADQLQAHSGPHFLRWLEACREAFGRELVDAAAAARQNEQQPR